MTGWSINPAGVHLVLAAIETDAEGLGASFGGVGPAQDELDSGSARTAGMRAAAGNGSTEQFILAESAVAASNLIESLESRVTAISARIQACGLGAGEATMAYLRGDEEMAGSTQAAAVAAATSGDLTLFAAR